MSSRKNIMRRVYMIWFLRGAISPFWVKVYLTLALAWELVLQVSFADVFHNAPRFSHIPESISFFTQAIGHASGVVQVALVGLVVFGVLIARDVFGRMGIFSLGRDAQVSV